MTGSIKWNSGAADIDTASNHEIHVGHVNTKDKEAEERQSCQDTDTCDTIHENSWKLHLLYESPNFSNFIKEDNPAHPAALNNFLKGCKWSPDGLCIAVCSDDNRLRLFNLPDTTSSYSVAESVSPTLGQSLEGISQSHTQDQPRMCRGFVEEETNEVNTQMQASYCEADILSSAYHSQSLFSHGQLAQNARPIQPVLTFSEGELIYDYQWLPAMDSQDPVTCLLASSCRDHPTHVWDAYSGELRATFRSYDQYDEIAAAHSLAFTPDSQSLLCGHKGLLHVFDIERPGRDYTVLELSKKGIRGIISTLAFSSDGGLLSIGCYSGKVALVDTSSSRLVTSLSLHHGVTHTIFSPISPHVYVGTRMSPRITAFDIRNTSRPLLFLERSVLTNQRVYFDIDPTGQYLLSGDQRGGIMCYDLWSSQSLDHEQSTTIKDATFQISHQRLINCRHATVVNGVSIHPYLDLVATASGQRRFDHGCDLEIEDSVSHQPQSPYAEHMLDNHLRLWNFTKI